MNDKFNEDEFYSGETSDGEDLYAEKISLDKPTKIPDAPRPKTFHSKSNVTLHPMDAIERYDNLSDSPRPKTFHSKNFTDSETQADEDKKKSAPHELELKQKLSRAETSGAVISAVMLVYSFSTQDKPLFFLSTALVIFLLRPLIGGLCGKHNRDVQNALHSFSVVLFIGALIMLFLGS